MSDKWSACLQTLEGHSEPVNSVTFSPDSSRLASASYDSTVKIWHASSGTCLQTLEGQGSADLISILASLHSSTTVMKPQQPAHQKTMISVESPWIFNNAQKLF
jgi:WD40 repeat protein